MRFNEIQQFDIDDLQLDEGNYRFIKAKDQKECIKKIYIANMPYFKGLMKSIAENDLGEPLLVLTNEAGVNIVADGNRRLSVSKVLHSDYYAPSPSIKEYAQELRSKNTIVFSNIQAQVSNNKELIAKTVHERHSSGNNGTTRIAWNAYAAARFGFDNSLGDHKEWYIMALLIKTEVEHPEIDVNSENFSYEVFRRLVRKAFSKQVISENIFSERGERIKKTARADLIRDAVSKALTFIKAIQKKEITLSRKEGTYADDAAVSKYIDSFSLSPDNEELRKAKETANQNGDKDNEDAGSNADGSNNNTENTDASQDSETETSDTNNEDGDNTRTSGNGIHKSDQIVNKLNKLKSIKLIRLYNSLCTISLNVHPELMYAGAWMFFEILAKHAGNINPKTGKTKHEFVGFINGKMQSWGFQTTIRDECFSALKEIHNFGNSAKHSAVRTRMTAIQLKNDFDVLEPAILSAIDEAMALKKSEKAE